MKRVVMTVIAVLCFAVSAGIVVKAETYSGSCGTSVKYVIDDSTGQMTISGTGAMNDIKYPQYRSWKDYLSVITSVVINDGVTHIGDNAFYGLNNLTEITIADSVKSIGAYSFYNCSSLTKVTISDGVTYIGCQAFSGCSSLIDVTIGDNVTNIDGYAFQKCTSLENVTFGNSVTDIGRYAFNGCTSLKEITIPDSVENIGDHAFYGASSLANIKIGSGVKYIGGTAFGLTACYESDDNWKDDMFYIDDYLIAAKQTVSGKCFIKTGTRIIANYAFARCSSITEIIVPNSVTHIGDFAFSECRGLKSIIIPISVLQIGEYAFNYCTDLENVEINEGVVTIGEYAFNYCIKLENVEINEGVVTIAYGAFYYCTALSGIKIPNSVTRIDNYAFYGCSELVDITMSDNIERIGTGAFNNTGYYKDSENWEDGLLYIGKCLYKADTTLSSECRIKEGTTVICDYAFKGCTDLPKAVIPNGVITIGNGAFSDCNSLERIEIAGSVKFIGESAFSFCYNLVDALYYGSEEDLIIEDSTVRFLDVLRYMYGSCGDKCKWKFDDETGLLIISGTGKMEDFSSGAPWYKSKLYIKEIIIENGITSIGDYAFYGCSSLTDVKIPNSIMSIGMRAFYGCEILTNAVYEGSEDDWSKVSVRLYNDYLNSALKFNNIEVRASISGTISDGILSVEAVNIPDNSDVSVLIFKDGVAKIYATKYSVNDNKTFPLEDGVDNVKVFAWKSFESMIPLCEAVEVEVN